MKLLLVNDVTDLNGEEFLEEPLSHYDLRKRSCRKHQLIYQKIYTTPSTSLHTSSFLSQDLWRGRV